MKRVKCFYHHLFSFLFFVPLIFLLRFLVLAKIGIRVEDKGFIDWINWNTYLIPLCWLIAIGVHAMLVFKFKFVQRWEEQKIRELIEKEDQESRQTWN